MRSAPPPGSRRFLPLYAYPVCPNCKSLLQNNPHPIENKASLCSMLAFSGAIILREPVQKVVDWVLPGTGIYLSLGLTIGLAGLAFWFQHAAQKRIPHNWPRYQTWKKAE
ncbi:hypothetical protein E9531_02160 [Lampropedia puyangensis]|uniref:Uncharacterized protein n=1 Tax=Lampropedia puyangensis TaxID=1330072 RepID=A0A4S8FI50_9BURK|nr:hypothetical protein [Lampropedia puyangensis]THU05362.1 hypothetical protein E9531_02160 [Lampropedia puyangensis]